MFVGTLEEFAAELERQANRIEAAADSPMKGLRLIDRARYRGEAYGRRAAAQMLRDAQILPSKADS